MSRVAIFGASAGIGQALTEEFRDDEIVTTFDRAERTVEGDQINFPWKHYTQTFPSLLTPSAQMKLASVNRVFITLGRPSLKKNLSVVVDNFEVVANIMEQCRGHVRGDCSFVFVASVSGMRADPDGAYYGASKAALISLARSYAREWAPMRVNCVAPGPTMTRQFMENVSVADQLLERQRSPFNRLLFPFEVAEAMKALADLSGVSGVCLPVDLAGVSSSRRF